MTSTNPESKAFPCVCKSNEGGECICVCTAPCAFSLENKTVEWTCRDCKCGKNVSCQRTFQLKCNRREEDGPGCSCSGDDSCERDVVTTKCACSSGECTIQVSKCKCCEITRIDCGWETASVVSEDGGKAGGCCGGSGCC